LISQWITSLTRAIGVTTIRVSNASPVAKWVFGNFTPNALLVQQPMHRYRWRLAATRVDVWFHNVADTVLVRVNAEIRKRAKASARAVKIFGGKP
jgi:hypothetical protein